MNQVERLDEAPDLGMLAVMSDALATGTTADEKARKARESVPTTWPEWLRFMFPAYVASPFAPHHEEFWDWLWKVFATEGPRPFCGIWPRGGGKSSGTELAAAVAACVLSPEEYVLYVSETQDQADKRVANVATLLEDDNVERCYPDASSPAVSKHGRPKAWRRDRLHCRSGFVVDPVGMETAARGLKVEARRPGLIILDELDGRHDTPRTTEKKIVTLTESILPMGGPRTIVIAVQNVIIPDGVFGQLATGKATFLVDRIVSGPIPAIRNMRTFQWMPGEEIPEKIRAEAEVDISRFTGVNEGMAVRSIITHGQATWEGQSVEVCQAIIDRTSLAAFLREQNHEVDVVEGALWKKINHVSDHPPLKRVVIGVDPSGGAAEIGIVTAGQGHDGRYYVIADDTQLGKLGPANWGRATVSAYDNNEGDRIVAEKNFGGDMVSDTIKVAGGDRRLPVTMVWSSRGKDIRAEPIVALYELGLVDHVGAFPEMETEMTRWVPGTKPSPNRLDALVFAMAELSTGNDGGFLIA